MEINQILIYVLINAAPPLSIRPMIALSELANESLVMLNKNSSIRTQIELAFKQAGILPAIVHDCPEIHSLIGWNVTVKRWNQFSIFSCCQPVYPAPHSQHSP